MSRIYDALIQAGEKRRHSGIGSQTQEKDDSRVLNLSWQNLRVAWKVMATGASVVLVFGLISMAIVNQVREALRTQIDKRALIIATNLSDAAAGHVIGRNILELHALVTKYARLEGSAYAFIEDGNGQIVAQSLRLFPAELRENLTVEDRRQVNRRVVSLQGKTVYETATPILEGQVGAARVGMWEEAVETEIHNAVLPTIALLVVMFLAGVIFAVVLTRGIFWRIGRLTDKAGETSVGDRQAVVNH